MRITGIIPARYASTRFPGKALAMIGNKSMIQRVYERASACDDLTEVVVATDDDRILSHVKSFGGKAILTADTHQSGTDRCLEAFQTMGEKSDIVINIQGDEPFIDPAAISELIRLFQNESCKIGTLVRVIFDEDEVHDPSCVKATLSKNGQALYFSRHPIPYLRRTDNVLWTHAHTYYAHVGMYGYRADTLKRIAHLPPSSLELAESLEQLRWLENGYVIHAAITEYHSAGIDTPADLQKALEKLPEEDR